MDIIENNNTPIIDPVAEIKDIYDAATYDQKKEVFKYIKHDLAMRDEHGN